MTLKKFARIVRTAGTDAEIARSKAHSPEFRKAVTKDRRSALSEYDAVKDALRDRARIEATKGSKAKAPKRSNGKGK